MKKYYLTYVGAVLPLASYANNSSSQGDDLPLLYKIGIVILFLIFLSLIWIQIEAKKIRKKSEADKKITEEDKSIVKKNQDLQNDIANLRKQLSNKDDEIDSLNTKLNKMEKENEILRKQIDELNSSSSRSESSSNDSINNKEDNNEGTNWSKNNYTNSNPIVGNSYYYELAVINGSLVKAESEQTTYFRAWREKGQILFEFVNNDRTRKAINNRTIIIEPFCIKLESSKSPDISEEIETKTPGILNDDFTLRKKAEIIYK